MSVKIIALLGCARSGSTMLEGKLQEAVDITALGEVTWVWSKGFIQDETCGCGASFSKCDFWRAVLAEAFGAVTTADAQRFDAAFRFARGTVVDWDTQLGRSPPVDPLFKDIVNALYPAAHKVGGGRPLLDSSKSARFTASLMAADVGRIMPVHMFREPRQNVYSLMTPKARPQSQDGGKATMAKARSVFHATAIWNLRNLQASNVVRKHDGRKATVSYHRFCQSADEQLQALASELGLNPRRAGDAQAWHSVSGNPMRFATDRLQIRTDERCRSGLTKLDQSVIVLASEWQEKRLERRSVG